MLTLESLDLAFSGKTLFDNVHFTVNPGEKIGLLGRNGTGKSTLFKCICGVVSPDSGKIKKKPHLSIGYLEQHMMFTKETVLEEVCLALPEERFWEEWRAEKMLLSLGFSEEGLIEDPKTFSGGWQIKMQLAKLLLAEPDLLLLDEPTNYLDILSIRWLKHMLIEWPHAFILITHDRGFMDAVTNHTALLHRHTLQKHALESSKLLDNVAHQEAMHEQRRLNLESKQAQQRAWIAKFKAKASMASRVQSKVKALEKETTLEKLETIEDLCFSFTSAPFQSKEPLIKVHNLHFGYERQPMLMQKLGFQIEMGDKIGIIGKNGQGKSTLLKLIAKQLSPSKGNIGHHIKTDYGYFGQMNIETLDPNLTVYQTLAQGASLQNEAAIRAVCAQMLFSGQQADKTIAKLSGGEKSRVVLGKILLKPCNCLLLDEPTNHLDLYAADALTHALKTFPGSVVIVTHDEQMLRAVCNHLIIFDRNEVRYLRNDYTHFINTIGWKEETEEA